MARKKKNELPSGNIRVQVYDYTDDTGKKHYKSFTAPTKALAQAKATEWKNHRRELKESLTVSQACERYIELKKNVLAPSTVRGYYTHLRQIQKFPIADIDMAVVKNVNVQKFVSDFAIIHSPKSVKNVYSLIKSTFSVFLPNFKLNVTLPQKIKVDSYTPSISDVQVLLDHCKTPELKVAILFAAVGTMRRGEVCAVTFDDVDFKNRTIRINKAYSQSEQWRWVIRQTKTYDSSRTVRVPQYVIDLIKTIHHDKETVVGLTPNALYLRFERALRDSGLPPFRFHDLRHHAASQMHALGIPDRYIEAIGGWKPGSTVLKRVYENVIDEERTKIENLYEENSSFTV